MVLIIHHGRVHHHLFDFFLEDEDSAIAGGLPLTLSWLRLARLILRRLTLVLLVLLVLRLRTLRLLTRGLSRRTMPCLILTLRRLRRGLWYGGCDCLMAACYGGGKEKNN